MHPFSLTEEQVDQVHGGSVASFFPGVTRPLPPIGIVGGPFTLPPGWNITPICPLTSITSGEEGGTPLYIPGQPYPPVPGGAVVSA